MKVLLIVHDNFTDANWFPLSTGYLASSLRDAGHDVSICCQDVFHFSNPELTWNFIQNNNWDVIGLGFLSARFNEAVLSLCKEINKYKGDAKLVLGGHGASAVPEYTLEATGADAVVVGEAENMDLDKLDGVVSFPRKDIDEIPFPAWDMFPMDKYTTGISYPGMTKDDRIMSMITSRGCVNRCSFCYRMNKGWRPRRAKDVHTEMGYLNVDYGVNYFEFQDEVLAPSYKRLDELIPYDLELPKPFKFACSLRVDEITEDVCQLLKERGCQYVTVGFESMNPDVLNEYNKNITPQDNVDAAELLKKYNIPISINFIWGAPSDTARDLWESVKFIRKYNSYVECRTIRPVTPYPGCEMYHDAIKKGLLDGPEDFFRKFTNSDRFTVNFTSYPERMLYWYLYQANQTLIWDYYRHENKRGAYGLINDFYNLYFNDPCYKFRGARSYEKN